MLRIRHMRDHAVEAINLLGDRTQNQLQQDRVLQLALVQLIEIVGEAAARVPVSFRENHSAVPWQLAADMRNKLIHGNDVIDFAVVFDTVMDDLPTLVKQLDTLIHD